MKLAIISDLHFGDPMCGLVKQNTRGRGYKIGNKYSNFKKSVGTGNKYLILLGDIFDFSITSYAEAYVSAQVFFSQIVADDIAEEIIYIPGNHDFEFWHWVENEVNVTKQIQKGNPPRNFRWSVPGIIDSRIGAEKEGFYLPSVTRQTGTHPYGGLFLDILTQNRIPFNVAYPNIYLVNDSMSILITHGHYLELYWALLGEIAPKIFGGDLDIGQFFDLTELVAVNFPTNQIASSGIGQAGPLTDCIRFIQRKIKDKDLDSIKKYINNLDDKIIDPFINYKKYDPREFISDKCIDIVKKKLLKVLGKIKDTRYSEDFVKEPEVLKRFNTYYLASVAEIENLNDNYGYNIPSDIPYPKHVIFGHTHRPIPWDDNHLKTRIEGTTVRLHNTGGWLFRKDKEGNQVFVGAEIFLFDDGQMYSVSVN
ncbi:metallophosphoesterase [Candidatus Latescibacterota bacterium]